MKDYKQHNKPLYKVGDYVFIIGRLHAYQVTACYRVESWYYYELACQVGFLTREDKLKEKNSE